MNILSPSMLAADFSVLGEQLKSVEEGGARYLHVDIMDGAFVPSLSFGMSVVKSIRKSSNLFFDVHLMIESPERYVAEFAAAGADMITVHFEACEDVTKVLEQVKNTGTKVGLAIKPKTPVDVIIPYLDQVDMILVMSVEPGFGGQGYLTESTERIRSVHNLIKDCAKKIDLEVDGGIKLNNVQTVLDAGANIIVAGTSVFNDHIKQNVESFMEILNQS